MLTKNGIVMHSLFFLVLLIRKTKGITKATSEVHHTPENYHASSIFAIEEGEEKLVYLTFCLNILI